MELDSFVLLDQGGRESSFDVVIIRNRGIWLRRPVSNKKKTNRPRFMLEGLCGPWYLLFYAHRLYMNYIIAMLLLICCISTRNHLLYLSRFCPGSTPKIASKNSQQRTYEICSYVAAWLVLKQSNKNWSILTVIVYFFQSYYIKLTCYSWFPVSLRRDQFNVFPIICDVTQFRGPPSAIWRKNLTWHISLVHSLLWFSALFDFRVSSQVLIVVLTFVSHVLF